MRIKLIEAKCSEQSRPMENVSIITTYVIKHKLCFTRSLCLLGWRIPHQYGQTYPMKRLRREGETCCICLCQRESNTSPWRVRSRAKKAQKVLPEHRWADVDSLSVVHHAGKLQFEVTNLSEPRWGSPSCLRHNLFEGDTEKQWLWKINTCVWDPPVGSGQEPLVLCANREMLGAKSARPWTRNHLCRPCALETYADCCVSLSNRFSW